MKPVTQSLYNKSYGSTLCEDIDAACEDIDAALSVFECASRCMIGGRGDKPSLNKIDLCYVAYREMCKVLGQIDGRFRLAQKDVALYKTPSESLVPLKRLEMLASSEEDKEVQRLLSFDNEDLWECASGYLWDKERWIRVGVGQDQLSVVRKCRLVDSVSQVEMEFLNDDKLFLYDAETMIRSKVSDDCMDDNRDYWINIVNTARALYVGLMRKGCKIIL